jgi:hypothetical protein
VSLVSTTQLAKETDPMSEYQLYYSEVARNSATWADPDASACGCKGRGWWCSEVDSVHSCPFHRDESPYPSPEEEPEGNYTLAKGGAEVWFEVYPSGVYVQHGRTSGRYMLVKEARAYYKGLVSKGYRRTL